MLSKEEIERERLTLVQWWVRLEEFRTAEAIRQTAIYFNRKFDRLFGLSAFSLRRVCMSAVTTTVLVGVTSSLYAVTGAGPTLHELNKGGLLALFSVNLVLDFLNLAKSRDFLSYAESSPLWLLGVIAFMDLVVSSVLFLGCSIITVSFVVDNFPGPRASGVHGSEFARLANFFGAAAFIASLLFYMFLLVTLGIKFLGLTRPRLMLLLEKLSSSNDLFKTFGSILGALLAAGKGIGDFITALA
jgi:hypothetical protein